MFQLTAAPNLSSIKACLVLSTALASLLASCGDGGAETDTAGTTAGISSTPMLVGPFNAQRTLICGVEVAPNQLRGPVLRVHDGDTITIGGYPEPVSVRLEGIDAPELAQPYGQQAQVALESALLGKTVVVTHSKNDRYGRVVGSVFTEDCRHANLDQLATGLAWFYRAYQCELFGQVRGLFAEAEAKAKAERRGLWLQATPQAPWLYRNGVNPEVPNCLSDMATGLALAHMLEAGSPTAGPGSVGYVSDIPAGSSLAGNFGSTASSGATATPNSCGPKTTCSQMTSCAEARQYLACGVRQLDENGDGVPCEAGVCRP